MVIARGYIFNDANKRTALARPLFYLACNNLLIRNLPQYQARLADLILDATIGDRGVADPKVQLRTFIDFSYFCFRHWEANVTLLLILAGVWRVSSDGL